MSHSFDSQTASKCQLHSYQTGGDMVHPNTNQLLSQQENLGSSDQFETSQRNRALREHRGYAVRSFLTLKSPNLVNTPKTANSTTAAGVAHMKRLSSIKLSSGSTYQLKTKSSIEVESPLFCRGTHEAIRNVNLQQTYFLLKFLPKYITEDEVFVKISRFGVPVFFHFLVGEHLVMTKGVSEADSAALTGEMVTKVSRQAVFSFQENESVSAFAKLNRIRIKGLQVKITKIHFSEAQQLVSESAAQRSDTQEINTPSNVLPGGLNSQLLCFNEAVLFSHGCAPIFSGFHCVKPTGKLYFQLRASKHKASRSQEATLQEGDASERYIYRVTRNKRLTQGNV